MDKGKQSIQKYFELDDKETKSYPNLWDVDKAVLRGKVFLNAYIRKEEKLNASGMCPSQLSSNIKQTATKK